MKKLIFITLLFITKNLYSQKNELSGNVVDFKGGKHEFFYAVLISETEPNNKTGNTFTDGTFIFRNINEGNYKLTISIVGYENYQCTVGIKKNEKIVLDTIKLTSTNLINEIEISGKLPTFKQEQDKFIFRVESSSISEIGNSIDVLKQTPLVLIDNNNNIMVAGKNNPLILIDGKKITLNKELEMLNSSDILKIEILTTPSAKYEASSHAVINIVTKKNQKASGFSTSFKLQSTFARRESYVGGINMAYKVNNLSAYANYNFSPGEQLYYEKDHRETTLSSGEIYRTNYNQTTLSKYKEHYFKSGFQYDLPHRQTIGFQTNGELGFGTENKEISNQYTFDTEGENKTNSLEKGNSFSNNMNFNYDINIDTSGHSFSFLADYSVENLNTDNEIKELSNDVSVENKSESETEYKIFSLKADYVLPLHKPEAVIESGVKYSFVENLGETVFSKFTDAGFTENDLYTNTLLFSEKIISNYIIVKKSISKLSINAGVRSEYIITKGQSGKSSIPENSNLKLFPTFNLSYKYSDNFSANLSYSKKINRPPYSYLNPTVLYFDKYFALTGNPNLKPSIFHTLELNLNIYKNFTVIPGYSKVYNPIYPYYYQDSLNSELTFVVRWNYNSMDYYYLNISHNTEFKRFSMQNSIGFKKPVMQIIDHGTKRNLKTPLFYFESSVDYEFYKETKININFTFLAPGETNMDNTEPYYDLSVSLQKKFLNKKLKLNIYASDILKSWYSKSNWSIYNMNRYHEFSGDNSYLRIRISYDLGTIKHSIKSRSGNQEELNRL